MKTKIIIFSKNRAMMLEALLRSLGNKYETYTIFKATAPEFRKGYKKLGFTAKKGKGYVDETDLKKDLLNAFQGTEQICLMVDDDIVFDNSFVIPELNRNETYSLRMHKKIKNTIHYNYHISLDGNIFMTADIKQHINAIEFKTPNQLESRLQGAFGKIFKMSYGEGYLIGFNHTRCAIDSGCFFSGLYSDEELNKRFLNGEIIDFEAMQIKQIDNVHSSQLYQFKKL